MTNIYRLIIFLPFVILGCAPNVIEENKVIQTTDSLNMNIFSKEGNKIYSIASPKSSYNLGELKFVIKGPSRLNKGVRTVGQCDYHIGH